MLSRGVADLKATLRFCPLVFSPALEKQNSFVLLGP